MSDKTARAAHSLPQALGSREIWTILANTDQTEGRGTEYYVGYYSLQSSALREARGRGVMGSNAPVSQLTAYQFKESGSWYAPVRIIPPTADDVNAETKLNLKNAALEKIKSVGLTPEELKALGLS